MTDKPDPLDQNEIDHLIGMCPDWAMHHATDGYPGLSAFLIRCMSAMVAQRTEIERLRAEVASLRLTLGGKTFGPSVPDPIGCPMPGACAQVAEINRLRRGWLKVIQTENQCGATGSPCEAKRCGCEAERDLLADE